MDEVQYVVPERQGSQHPNPPKKPNKVLTWVKSHKPLSIALVAMAGIVILMGSLMFTGKKVTLLGVNLNPLYNQAGCLPSDGCGTEEANITSETDPTRTTINGSFADGIVGVPYTQQFTVSGSNATQCSWAITGMSPQVEGTSIAVKDGSRYSATFKSTPQVVGTVQVTLTVTCGRTTDTKVLPWKINAASSTDMSIEGIFSNGIAGQDYEASVVLKNPQGSCLLTLISVTPQVAGAGLFANERIPSSPDRNYIFKAKPASGGDYTVKVQANCDPLVGDGKSTTIEKDFPWIVLMYPIDPVEPVGIVANFTDAQVGQQYTTPVTSDSTRGGIYTCSMSLVKIVPDVKGATLTRVKSTDLSKPMTYNFVATPTVAGTYKVTVGLTCNPTGDIKIKSTYTEKEFTWKVIASPTTGGGGTGGETPAAVGSCTTPENLAMLVPVYRYWSRNAGDHFYTTDPNEKASGYLSEGISGYLFKTPVAGTKAIYRSYKPAITSHYYSTVDDAVNYGYANEGILGYGFSSEVSGSGSWFRLHQGYPSSDYLETMSTKEKAEVIARGFADEGIVAYLCTKN